MSSSRPVDLEMSPLRESSFSFLPSSEQDAASMLMNGHGVHDQGLIHVKVPHFALPRRYVVCGGCCIVLALGWTLATFALQVHHSICWTARDELELLNRFNALSAELGDGPWPLRNAHRSVRYFH